MGTLDHHSLRRVHSSYVDLGIELKADGDIDHGCKNVCLIGIVRYLTAVREANGM